MNALNRINHWFIGEYLQRIDHPFEKAKIKLIYNIAFFYSLSGVAFLFHLLNTHQYERAIINSIGMPMGIFILIALKLRRSIKLSALIFTIGGFLLLFANNFFKGARINIYSAQWLLFYILFTHFVLGKKWGRVLSLSGVFAMAMSIILARYGFGLAAGVDNYLIDVSNPDPIGVITPMAFSYYIILQFINTRSEAEAKLLGANRELAVLNAELKDREDKMIETNAQLSELNLVITESEHRLADALKIAKLGSWEVNLSTKVSYWSAETFEIAGFPAESNPPRWKDVLRNISPEDVPRVKRKLRLAISNQKPFEIEVKYGFPNGSSKHLLVKGKVIHHYNCITLLTGTVLDITERVQAEREIIEAKEKAERASQVKSQFLSAMSHEIRTPMHAVIGLTSLLLAEDPKPEQIYNLKTLKFSAESLLSLINNILDFNKIEAGKVDFEEISFNLQYLLNGIKQSFIPITKDKGIGLKIIQDTDLPQFVAGDPVRLTQVLNNLVGNAVKFTEQGEVTVKIRVEQETEQEVCLSFAVTDTGIGISPENLESIFENFTQANTDTTRKFGGTGLGLSITRQLLKLQGSQIKVKSSLGKGSTFYFSLIFRKSTKPLPSPSSTLHHTPGANSLKGLKLLLAEDNSVNQFIASKLLARWEMEIDFANTGREAVDKASAKEYDIILMDLQMPEMDGYDATVLIRQLPGVHYQSVPVIALTAWATQEVKDKVLGIGMNDYVTKPFNPEELSAKIKQYVNKNRISA